MFFLKIGRSFNPISTKGVRLCPPNNIGTPGFSEFQTALNKTVLVLKPLRFENKNIIIKLGQNYARLLLYHN